MASHDLELDMVIKTDAKPELRIRGVNDPLISVNYPNGNFAGVVNKNHITHVQVNGKWEEYTP